MEWSSTEAGQVCTCPRSFKHADSSNHGQAKRSSAMCTSTAWMQSLTTATDELCRRRRMAIRYSGELVAMYRGRGSRDGCQLPCWKAGMVSCRHTRDGMSLDYHSVECCCSTKRPPKWQVARSGPSGMFARSWAAGERGTWARVIGIVAGRSWNFGSAKFCWVPFIKADD